MEENFFWLLWESDVITEDGAGFEEEGRGHKQTSVSIESKIIGPQSKVIGMKI